MALCDFTLEQWEGAAFLAERSVAMLADKVGFGKSAQFVLACDIVGASNVLVVCPPNLRQNEIAEFSKWSATDRPAKIIKTGKDGIPTGGLVVISYSLARRPEMIERLRQFPADVLILDEAHAAKSNAGATTLALLSANGIAAKIPRLWFATGTPNPNNASEWYPFAKACGAWTGTFEGFADFYCHVQNVWANGAFRQKIRGSKNVEALRQKLAPFVLSRSKTEEGRPPLEVLDFICDAAVPKFDGIEPAELAAIETAIEFEDFEALKGVRGDIVATVRRIIGMAKAESVAELVSSDLESDPTNRAIVFCDHTDTIDIIAAKLAGYGVGIIDGRTKSKDRELYFSFFEPGGPVNSIRVLVCHRLSAGEGRTLTAANFVYMAEPPWTPDQVGQMIARADRRGQTRPVTARLCYLPGSIDMAVARVNARKRHDTNALQIGVR